VVSTDELLQPWRTYQHALANPRGGHDVDDLEARIWRVTAVPGFEQPDFDALHRLAFAPPRPPRPVRGVIDEARSCLED
jgi:hypothetical protein